jgi:hypothetical protein
MVVTKGTVVYTIDEQEFGEKSAGPAPKAPVAAKAPVAPAETPAATPAEAPKAD